MKDDEKVELKVGDIKRAAGKCETAKEILKELFPDVFKVSPPEWEKMSLSEFCLDMGTETGATLYWKAGGLNPFAIILSNLASGTSGEFKVEDGQLWRRK